MGNSVCNGKTLAMVVASSTGGTNALEVLLRDLPALCVPTVIVQHIRPGFTALLADRLNQISRMEVREAVSGDTLKPGLALLAPADVHTRLAVHRGALSVECFAGERMHGVMPAADVLFGSAANILRDKAIGVVLTGMGDDGARGLLEMRMAGARTIAQDRETSVVYGMPKKAYEIGAAEFVLPLDRIAGKIADMLNLC